MFASNSVALIGDPLTETFVVVTGYDADI
jgi:hypothetical protein